MGVALDVGVEVEVGVSESFSPAVSSLLRLPFGCSASAGCTSATANITGSVAPVRIVIVCLGITFRHNKVSLSSAFQNSRI
jgi:hypothetical protein